MSEVIAQVVVSEFDYSAKVFSVGEYRVIDGEVFVGVALDNGDEADLPLSDLTLTVV